MKYHWIFANNFDEDESDPTIFLFDPVTKIEYMYDRYTDFSGEPVPIGFDVDSWKAQFKKVGGFKEVEANSIEEAMDILRRQYPEIRL